MRCPATEEVVLLPLVPVTTRTRRRSASASHRPRPPATGTPAAASPAISGRYRDMPGVFTTASQPARAASPPPAVTSTGWPSTGAAGRSSTRTGSAPRVASLRRLAWPSRPRPQIPTRAPARSDQESLGRLIGVLVRDEIAADRPQHGFGLRRRRRVRPARHLGGQRGQQSVARPVRPPRGQQDRGPALGDLADALERLGARAEQRPELAAQGGVPERLAGRREDP